ncbi:unnamed protein product [Rodentolepis nana]|uniref:Kunitz/Bovine pancreatic trypsin inhibitor domain protein n=1 Tax=Rodentolepis nana TaxID=102285 RepID=A0A0R3TAK2_RODNA|nr:unnamed protein product [Rodentolepis nana]
MKGTTKNNAGITWNSAKPAQSNNVLDLVCRLPPDVGPCRALVPRWAFDASQGRCIEFSYGGCRGNDNNFHSKEEFDPNTGQFVQFICRRCSGDDNFETIEACEEPAISTTALTDINKALDPACKLLQDIGPCKASVTRWSFDMSKGECVQFNYGGCKGNANNFESKEICEDRCVASVSPPKAVPSDASLSENDDNISPSFCNLQLEHGNCYAFIRRWGFDGESGKCVEFAYGGCGGNENNFESNEACEKYCSTKISNSQPADAIAAHNPICGLPREVGPCRSMLKRWYFDVASGKCTDFIYGGCQGNDNNFETEDECENVCSAYEDDPSLEDDDDVDLTDASMCHLPRERGNCGASLQRWGFDAFAGRCVQFIYSGCAGNDNNFETRDVCEQRCLANIPHNAPTDVNDSAHPHCRLPMEVGPCRGRLQRWYYDTSSAQCLEFYYGGCRGNANQFQSKEACEAKCKASSAFPQSPPVFFSEVVSGDTSICYLPHESGSCEADMRRWGFHADSSKCIQFHYGGCGGNANNFRTKTECEQRCLANYPIGEPANVNDAMDPVCGLPQEVGPCRVYMKRWSYDASMAQCVEFNYGGCRGNANNFKTKEACETKCDVGNSAAIDW